MEDSFAVVLPYYNEAEFLGHTIESLLAQSHLPAQLILVDNGSSDDSAAICRQVLRRERRFEVIHEREPCPGKIHALHRAVRQVRSEYIAFTDADTYYPPHYLATCNRLFAAGGRKCVAVMAKDIYCSPHSASGVWTRWFYAGLSRVLYWQCFAGGCGQTVRTSSYFACGGYSSELWNYTLEDHEIMNRLHKLGRSVYHPRLWCMPSPRRRDRSKVGWNFGEQMLYLVTPPRLGDWFFNRFLAGRFERRQIFQTNLREQVWREAEEAPVTRRRAA